MFFFLAFFTTPKHSHHSFAACFEEKQENEKKYNNKGCQEIIGLILFGKNLKVTATHRNVVVKCYRIEKNIKDIFFLLRVYCASWRAPSLPWARSIQRKFPEISVQNLMDRFGLTGKVSKKRVHLLRWTTFPGRTGWNFGWMDQAPQGSLLLLTRRRS